MKKGIISKYLCTNPSCAYSENKIVVKDALTFGGTQAKFKILTKCPKCKSGVEILNFVSGNVEITEDTNFPEKEN